MERNLTNTGTQVEPDVPIHWYCEACGWELYSPAESPDPAKIPDDARAKFDQHRCSGFAART